MKNKVGIEVWGIDNKVEGGKLIKLGRIVSTAKNADGDNIEFPFGLSNIKSGNNANGIDFSFGAKSKNILDGGLMEQFIQLYAQLLGSPLDGKGINSVPETALTIENAIEDIENEQKNTENKTKAPKIDTINGPSFTDESGKTGKTKIIRENEKNKKTLYFTD